MDQEKLVYDLIEQAVEYSDIGGNYLLLNELREAEQHLGEALGLLREASLSLKPGNDEVPPHVLDPDDLMEASFPFQMTNHQGLYVYSSSFRLHEVIKPTTHDVLVYSAVVVFHLALVFHLRGQHAKAADMYSICLDLMFVRGSPSRLQLVAWNNQAVCLYELSSTEAAKSAATVVFSYLNNDGGVQASLTTKLHMNVGFILEVDSHAARAA